MGNTVSSHLVWLLEFPVTFFTTTRDVLELRTNPILPLYTSQSVDPIGASSSYAGLSTTVVLPRRPTFRHRSDPVALSPHPQPPLHIRGPISIGVNQGSIFGGFNQVIQGYHEGFGRVALRRSIASDHLGISNEQSHVFALTVQLWWGLRHPHILRLLGTYEIDRHVYTVSKWAANGTLDEYLSNHPGACLRTLLLEAARGTEYMHSKGIIHGDIKPKNLLVTADHHVQLCDFDLARRMTEITHPVFKGVGSYRYQAPELWNGKSKSAKSDVYAFGMTMCEALSGKPPFHDCELSGQVYRAVLVDNERPPQEPKFSPVHESYEPLWEIVRDCWNSDPERRPSMTEVVQRLSRQTHSTPSAILLSTH